MSSPAQPIQQNAPVAPSVPAPPAPDLSSLTNAGQNFQLDPREAVGPGGTNINQETAAAQAANQKYQTDAAAPPKVAPTPGVYTGNHAGLLRMIQGLAIGMSSFGTSLATHGREGGAPEVADFYAKQNEERLQNQEAAQNQKNQALNQDLTMANLHMENAKTLQSLFTLNDEINSSHLKVEQSEQDLANAQNPTPSTAQQAVTPFGQQKADQLNSALLQRYQVLNPTAKTLPTGFSLDANSTPNDFNRIDKIMQQSETAQGTKAQQDTANAIRKETLAFQQQKLNPNAPNGNSGLTGDAFIRTLPPAEQSLVTDIGKGQMAPERLSYLLSRNPTLMQQVSQAYPDFDSSKIQNYPTVRKDFTSGPTSVQLVSGGTALQHLNELKQINDANPTDSRIPTTAAYKAYQNKLDTVAGELVKFYGMPDTDKSIDAMKKTLGGLWNRDSAILTQAKSMGDRLDNLETKWNNAAPSAAYRQPMPGISPQAKAARAALDPEYAARQQGSQPTAQHSVGDRVTLKNGQQVIIKSINPNGTFNY